MSDTPIKMVNGDMFVTIDPGQRVVFGQTFEFGHGYRVAFGFDGSEQFNLLSVELARSVSDILRLAQAPGNDAQMIADHLSSVTDQVEQLNEYWAAMGRPIGGFEAEAAGHA